MWQKMQQSYLMKKTLGLVVMEGKRGDRRLWGMQKRRKRWRGREEPYLISL